MSVYYQDDYVTLYHGDCLEVLPTLDLEATALLTDPPYFKVKEDEWDNQWAKASEFLSWMGTFLDAAKPLLTANASVWVFASPAMTSSVERLVGERFRALNSIRWLKGQSSMSNRASLGGLRAFLPVWEGIVFAEQFADEYGDAAKALHREVFAPIGRYLQTERERAGVSRKDVAKRLQEYKNLDSATANVSNWELGKNLISARDYRSVREAINGATGGEYLRREYEGLRSEYEDLRRPFNVTQRRYSTDVWDFAGTPRLEGRHPCEKPQPLLRHMIETSTKRGQTILDPFSGSGSTLQAARDLGRKAIGIELDERYCEQTANRLSQHAFDFGDLT